MICSLSDPFNADNMSLVSLITDSQLRGDGELEHDAEEDPEGDDAEDDPHDDKVAGAAAQAGLLLVLAGHGGDLLADVPHGQLAGGAVLSHDHPVMT